MSRVTCYISVSSDGYVAGPRQTQDDPLGVGGMRLHDGHFDPTPDDRVVIEEWLGANGAYVMGRNMFGPGRGEWDLDWTGWWGQEPPYGVPVFVLTHHERERLVLGATTFDFVSDGIESALALANDAAGDRRVSIAGGASTVNQYLAAGLVDELHLHIAPVVLGAGERLFEGVPPQDLEPVRVAGSPRATHVKYRVRHDGG